MWAPFNMPSTVAKGFLKFLSYMKGPDKKELKYPGIHTI
jgi:hypothetical protein